MSVVIRKKNLKGNKNKENACRKPFHYTTFPLGRKYCNLNRLLTLHAELMENCIELIPSIRFKFIFTTFEQPSWFAVKSKYTHISTLTRVLFIFHGNFRLRGHFNWTSRIRILLILSEMEIHTLFWMYGLDRLNSICHPLPHYFCFLTFPIEQLECCSRCLLTHANYFDIICIKYTYYLTTLILIEILWMTHIF